MSEHDVVHEAVERLEWSERNDDPTPLSRWREVTRRSALTGGAVGLTAFLLEACGGGSNKSSSSAQSGTPATGVFGEQKPFKFTFVNHVTTNPFFVPTQYGAEDACKLLGCTYQWTGSESSNVSQMVNAFNSAVSAKVDGIAVALVDLQGVQRADQEGARGRHPGRRLQRRRAGQRAARLHRPGPDRVRGKDGQTDHRPGRLGRRRAVHRDAGLGRTSSRASKARSTRSRSRAARSRAHTIATGAAVPGELSAIDAYCSATRA